ncbi:serine hydrolase [Streptomyces sp. NPDC094048]|uniref:serine hydrolase n=1 Tax=unclassified Streptomyces TaxID=2593676 RepID=UPI00332A8A53
MYQHGELVVDAVAGVADPGSGRTVASDIPFYSASTGKGVTATVALVLAEVDPQEWTPGFMHE